MPVPLSLVLAKLAVLAATPGLAPEPEGVPSPGDHRPVLDEKQFARLRATLPEADFSYHLCCHLLDVEFHLEEIARARLVRDFPRICGKAQTVAGMADDVGAMRVRAAARRLGAACRGGDCREISRRIAELGERCTESEMELRRFLAYRALAAGGA